ncbi:MAG: phosphoglucosamine mutase [Acidobacteriota bacterium]
MKKLFGTDGIRGVAGLYPLDEPTVTRLGEALARTLARRGHAAGGKRPRILFGRDTRESGSWIEHSLATGSCRAGAQCVSAGVIPTPGVAYLARTGPFSAGVMISASHNPYRDNGIKIFSSEGYKLPDEEEMDIERLALDGADVSASQELVGCSVGDAADLVGRYETFLLGAVDQGVSFSGMKLVLDCANGASTRIAPAVFRALGAEVEVLFDAPDGHNINEGCGSLHPETLAATVVERGADLGIAFDGDADRALFVSADGAMADGDVLIYQAACHLDERGLLAGRSVVATVMSNLWLERSLAEHGIGLTRTQVGDKYVLEEMIRTGAVLGGEQSGHIIFADRATTGDGVMTALRLLQVLHDTGETVSDWLGRVQALPQLLLNVPVASRPDLETHPVIGAEAENVRRELGGTGRLVLRYSGTEPVARVMIEAVDPRQVESLTRRLADVIAREIGKR